MKKLQLGKSKNNETPAKRKISYQEWFNFLPENLRKTDTTEYNLRGAYEGGLKPVVEEDGTFHLSSRNPITEEILKSPNHPTWDKMVESERQAGYELYQKDNKWFSKPTKNQFGKSNKNKKLENIVFDKNDPRLKAYNDSLTLYNNSNYFTENEIVKNYHNNVKGRTTEGRAYRGYLDPNNKIKPSGFRGIDLGDSTYSKEFPIFKKPTQKFTFQKPIDKTDLPDIQKIGRSDTKPKMRDIEVPEVSGEYKDEQALKSKYKNKSLPPVEGELMNDYNERNHAWLEYGQLTEPKIVKSKRQSEMGKNQYGGKEPILAEKGEVYRDRNGNIMQVPNNSPSHDDDEMVMGASVHETKEGNGGHIVEDSESMLSASYDQVKTGDRDNSIYEKALKFTKDDFQMLNESFGVKPKIRGSLSSSKTFDIYNKALIKKKEKLIKIKFAGKDQYSLASQKLNNQLANDTPDEQDLYNTIYELQETKKQTSGLNFDNISKGQYGKKRSWEDINKKYSTAIDAIRSGSKVPQNLNTTPSSPRLSPSGSVSSKADKRERDAREFYNDYYASDEYDDRLGFGVVDTHKEADKVNIVRAKDNEDLNRMYRGVNGKMAEGLTLGAFAIRGQNKIVYDPNKKHNFLPHELSHATEPRTVRKQISEYDIKVNPNARLNSEQLNYFSEPTEQRARLFEVHYDAKENGINNIIDGEEFDQNKLNKIRNSQGLDDLRKIHTDEQIIEMLNEVASNEDVQQYDEIQPAQYGGIPVSKQGMYDYPNQEVIVPTDNTGRITMKDINYSVDAYDADTNEFLETMEPNEEYEFQGVNNVREVPRGQAGKTKYSKNYPTDYPEYNKDNGQYTIRKGDWLSSVATKFGIPLKNIQELYDANPQITNKDLIKPGQKINIPEKYRSKSKQPVDLLPGMKLENYDGTITKEKDLGVGGEDITDYVNSLARKENSQEDRDVYGKLRREVPMNTFNAMQQANRIVNLPFRGEVPNRTLNYAEENPELYLDEINDSYEQVAQQVNPNDARGMAYMANLSANSNKQKRQVINRVNSSNLQRRNQTDNTNTQLQNQYDMVQNQQNERYVDGVQQTLANLDSNRVQQAQYLDQMIVNDQRYDNFMLMTAMKFGNFKIDPETNEVYRVGTDIKTPHKAKYGLKKKY